MTRWFTTVDAAADSTSVSGVVSVTITLSLLPFSGRVRSMRISSPERTLSPGRLTSWKDEWDARTSYVPERSPGIW